MVSFPPCKINLGLNILRKRSDGYHDIETCFYPVPFTDILEVIPSSEFSFTLSGNAVPGNVEDNLCVKAYRLMQAVYSLPPAKIHLHKIIPTGAGLGGGSSDAAWTLRLLNDVFDLKLSKETLKEYASRLGSDCAFFIDDGPMMGTGRGEILTPVKIDLKGKYLALVKPEVHVSTAQAYEGVRPAEPKNRIANILTKQVAEWRGLLENDFERTVGEKLPVIRSIKEKLYEAGAEYASMTGSGSAVYGIFSKKPQFEIGGRVQTVVML
ncbi:MAG TPA: 4-(cytidine 5'-diphospho)-2-C-methyl-D-erythritol kinase [Cyclobacteriaceae bacterium]|nr:4-(cytidine 5'-diphospho)-2-C-methyl-D-erythritol kinase [Cyclobacteriaceae bacterium]